MNTKDEISTFQKVAASWLWVATMNSRCGELIPLFSGLRSPGLGISNSLTTTCHHLTPPKRSTSEIHEDTWPQDSSGGLATSALKCTPIQLGVPQHQCFCSDQECPFDLNVPVWHTFWSCVGKHKLVSSGIDLNQILLARSIATETQPQKKERATLELVWSKTSITVYIMNIRSSAPKLNCFAVHP